MLGFIMRHAFVLAHRWLGIALALFLVPAAVTGSLLVWKNAIDERLNPGLYTVPAGNRAPLTETALLASLRSRFPDARIGWIEMPDAPGRSARLNVRNWPAGGDAERRINEVFVEPATAAVLGARSTVTPRFNRQEFIPWVLRFHYTLMLRRTGMVFMGAVAIAWTLDCVVGVVLTLPKPLIRWRKWRIAWGVRGSRLNFDAHRASGLWFWVVLAALALSSVYLNLGHEIFVPAAEWLAEILLPDHLQSPVVSTVMEWQYPLHTGEAFGLTGRIIVCVAGLIVTILAISGLVTTVRKLSRERRHVRSAADRVTPATNAAGV